MDNDHVGTAAHPLSGPRHVHFNLEDPGSPSFYLEDRLSFLDLNMPATSTPHPSPTRRPVRHNYCR
jgi:hypothetical protein